MIKLLLGGSPCTHWSIAQSKNRETKAEGVGWELFLNYVIAKEKFKPDFFLYENNWSASKEIKEQIQEELGCKLMRINSNLVSAQNRDRFYVFNWDVEQPASRGILLKNVLEEDVSTQHYYDKYCFKFIGRKHVCGKLNIKGMDIIKRVYHPDFKSPTLTTSQGGHRQPKVYINNRVRRLTPVEYERLQTLPDGYTSSVSNTQRYKCLGNGWTADVIIHILNGALKDIPKDEKILVLSMYDGIGTGRYCLDKMGFTNVEYHAYEIDKYAIQVSMSNYPDIIQHGDAFQVRLDNVTL